MNLFERLRGIPGEAAHLMGHLRLWVADQLDPDRRVPEHLDGLETAHATLALAGFARESHGNYSIVSSNGVYHGAYQFSVSTWNTVAQHAGRGDLVGVLPSQASPADQDAMALALYNWQGKAPWGGYC